MILLLLLDDFVISSEEEIINHLNLPCETFCNILFIAWHVIWYENCNFRYCLNLNTWGIIIRNSFALFRKSFDSKMHSAPQ